MKFFILKTILFLLFPGIVLIAAFFVADGVTDEFYMRFTTPRQKSMVVGTSRAAQGIQPYVIDSVFNAGNHKLNLFNYSFTVAHSPYGPAYYKSIRKKLDESSLTGKFIVAVDPWSISSKAQNPNDSSIFPENNLSVGKTKCIDCYPNFEYLTNSYSKPLLMVFVDKLLVALKMEGKESLLLHKDGWLEVTVSMDSMEVRKRIEKKVSDYEKNELPYYHFSSLRYEYLKKTIDLFQKHGDVYLVRLPVSKRMKDLDDRMLPEFDSVISSLAKSRNIPYLNFCLSSEDYKYTDGNHLYKESGYVLSKKIGELMLNNCCNEK